MQAAMRASVLPSRSVHSAVTFAPHNVNRVGPAHKCSTRIVARVAAAEPAAVEATELAPAPRAAIQTLDPAVAAEMEAEELDDAQEQLLKWMLYKDDKEQEIDLDEMIDYTEFGDDEYEELFEELDDLYDQFDYNFAVGDMVVGTVTEVDDDGAYIDIGAKGSAFMPTIEASFAKLKTALEVVRPGMKREFMVVEGEDEGDVKGQVTLSLGAMECATFWSRIRQMQEEDVTVYVTVESANRGGLLCMYGMYEGFIPGSQFGPDISMDTMETLVGFQIPVKFVEVDEEGQRLVFSNRRAGGSSTEIQGFAVGQVVTGVVQSVKPYGAFVDLGGVTGLLHVSQISHDRITSVDKVLAEGDKLKVMILSMDRDRGRVTLSTKKLEPTPGDMLKDPQLVYEKADEMAATFRRSVANAEVQAASGGEGFAMTGGPMDLGFGNDPTQGDMGSFV